MRVLWSEFVLKAPAGYFYYRWELTDDGPLEIDLRELTTGLPGDRHASEKRWAAEQIENAARVYGNRKRMKVSISCRKPYDTLTLRLWPKP